MKRHPVIIVRLEVEGDDLTAQSADEIAQRVVADAINRSYMNGFDVDPDVTVSPIEVRPFLT